MRKLFQITLFFIIVACSTNKSVYWCGDHACVNDKEKEDFFKKTMTVEIRDLKKDKFKKSDVEKIIYQATGSEKNIIKEEKSLNKQAKLEQKQRAKEEKLLKKQAKLEQKQRAKEEKLLKKQAKIEAKRITKEQKILDKQKEIENKQRKKDKKSLVKKIKRDEKKLLSKKKKVTNDKIVNRNLETNTAVSSTYFRNLVEKIINKNTFRPYPDINDIPN